ncbi:MAG: four helix bundle protein [Bacteroidales bacterium]|nr:four helix bundle protein [Bacteroidales bacterium]MDD4673164.1 four helix bundle protein [Bacteroidales bacterium]
MNERKLNVVRDKSFSFAIRMVHLYKYLSSNKKEYVLSKQLLRSGISVGANVREVVNAQSKKDFIHKLSIAQKECDETIYWLELLKETKYINISEFENSESEATELPKIIKSIIIATKNDSIIHN